MRLLRALILGPLVAGGAYCVGFVASRLGHELYPWAGPVFDALLPGWVALTAATAGFYGYFSRNAKLRGWVLATTFIVTVTGFYALAVELIDEHHETALRQKQESLQMVLGLLGRSAARENRCERFLLEERFAMTGDLTPNDASVARHYCSQRARSIQSGRDPIEGFWQAHDAQRDSQLTRGSDDV